MGGGKSYDGWYLVSVIQRFDWADAIDGESAPVWENYHLIRADTISQAYDEAMALPEYVSDRDPSTLGGRKGRWVTLGVSELLPIYDPLEHGSEIMWTDHGTIDQEAAEKLPRTKAEIESEFDS
jgi:hypothetical protein